MRVSFLSFALAPLLFLGTLLVGCSSPDACQGVVCEDLNVCTQDRCDPGTGTCAYSPVVDGTECDFAGLPGVCRGGQCTDADLCRDVDCDDQNDCTEERCIATTGLCERTNLPDGALCSDGGCEGGVCTSEFSCTQEGILNAIAAGGGPYTFACDGPTTVDGYMVIDNDVILDGEGDLVVRGRFTVNADVAAELRRMTIREGQDGCIHNLGTLLLSSCTVTEGFGEPSGGIYNEQGDLTVTDSTVSWNQFGGGIYNDQGTVTLINSTITQNEQWGVLNSRGVVTMTNCTVVHVFGSALDGFEGEVRVTGTLLQGSCREPLVTSGDYNIESPGNTCGFDATNDQVDVSEMELWLGTLKDNGGDTFTHLPGATSVAIDVISAEDCKATADQRGIDRPQGPRCDVGSVEVEAGP